MHTEKVSLHKLFWNADYVEIIAVKKILYFKTSQLPDLILFNSYIIKQVSKLKWFLISEGKKKKSLNWDS